MDQVMKLPDPASATSSIISRLRPDSIWINTQRPSQLTTNDELRNPLNIWPK